MDDKEITYIEDPAAPVIEAEAMAPESATLEVAEAEPNVELKEFPVAVLNSEKFADLAKANITLTAFKKAEALRGMSLKSLQDKDGFKDLYNAHQYLKGLISTAKNACKEGREPALEEQRKWIELEKGIVTWIETIEAPIEKQRKAYEAEQARIKAEEKKRLEERTNARGRQMQALGVPFDLKACQDLEDDAWEAFIKPHQEAKERTEKGKARAKQLMALNISGGDVEALGALSDEDWDSAFQDAKNIFDEAQEKARKEKADREEKERKEQEAMARYRKRFDFIAKSGFTVDQVGTTLEDLKAMSDDEFMALASKVKTLKDEREEKDRQDQAEKRKDEAFRLRYQELLVMKVEFSTELAAKVREMPQDEYDLFKGAIETEFNRKADEDRKAREAAMVPAPQVEDAQEPEPMPEDAQEPEAMPEAAQEPPAIQPKPMAAIPTMARKSMPAFTSSPAPAPSSPAEHPVKAWAEAIISSLEFAPGVEGPKAMDFQNLRTMAIETMKDIVTLFEEA